MTTSMVCDAPKKSFPGRIIWLVNRWLINRDFTPKKQLPYYAQLYFDHIRGEYRSLPQDKKEEIVPIVDELLRKEKRTLTWEDLYTFDLALTRCLGARELPRRVWCLRSRYRDVAGLREYEAYLASKPPEIMGEIKEEDLRGDIKFLLCEIYKRYAIMPERERVRDRISRRIAYAIIIGIGVAVLSVMLNNLPEGERISMGLSRIPLMPGTPAIVLFAGAMGGLISMLQRYQSAAGASDPIDSVSELEHDWFRIFLPSINGAIFAVVLYMIIAAGLIEGELFPDVKAERLTNHFLDFLRHTGPITFGDYAKLVVWCFVAGFAERFVPDTLSRFTAKRDQDKAASA